MNTLATAAPEAAVEAARKGVTRLRAGGGACPLRDAAGEQLYLAAPHRRYVLGLDDARSGTGARRATPAGWRFMVTNDTDALAAIDVRELGEDEFAFSALNYGPFVGSTVEAVRRLEETHETNDELRLLRCPALYLEALWLHGASDRFMPLDPAPTGFEAYHLYSEDEFTARLTEKAAAAHREGPALPP